MIDEPIRMTRQRAVALLTMFEAGVESERDSIRQAYGVKFNADGKLDVESIDLSEPGELEGLAPRIATLNEALAAAAIFTRRYLHS